MKLSILFLAAAALTEAARRKTFAEGEMGMTGTNVATGATDAPSTTVTSAPVVNTPASNDSAAGDDTAGTDTVAVQGGGSCPNVWKAISAELSGMFAGCNDDARAAIRSVFHDCFPSGGCDGSLAIPAELARKDNRGLVTYVNKIKALAKANKVTVADMISFAGSHAVVTCPGGPTVQTYVGRKDATKPAPDGQLPQANVGGDEALAKFQQRGFSAQDLGALIGAHSTSRQFVTDPAKAGTPEDTTPSKWDITYYQETIARKAPFSFQSDLNLANQSSVGPVMKAFSKSKSAWDGSFAPAMAHMEMLETPGASNMADCTNALPKPRSRRDIKAAPINGRLYH